MRYLVTGGAGFVGSHLTARLRQLGGEVIVLDDLSTGSLANLRATADAGVRLVCGCTCDRGLVDGLVAEVDVVCHLAAVVGVQRVVARPRAALRRNVLGAQAVLDAATRHRRPTLLTSSSEVYGPSRPGPLAEDAAVVSTATGTGRWAYARSKILAEAYALALHRARGLPVAVARLFNTVGPGQSGRGGMVLPRFVEQALAGRDVTVYGDGRQSRCFCDVDDVVDALVGLLHEPGAAGQVVNVGGQAETTIGGLAELVIARTASPSRVRLVPYEQAYGPGFEDVRRRVPDTTRIARLLGWRPHRDLDATVRRVIAAHRQRHSVAGDRPTMPRRAPVTPGLVATRRGSAAPTARSARRLVPPAVAAPAADPQGP